MSEHSGLGEVERLITERRLPQLAPAVYELAGALPRVAEDWIARQSPKAEGLREVLRTLLWPAVLDRYSWDTATRWPLMAAACLEAGEVLGIALEERAGRWTDGPVERAVGKHRAAIRSPRIYVLSPDRGPTRVLLGSLDGHEDHDDPPCVSQSRTLAKALMDWPDTPVWRLLDSGVVDESHMAGLLMRLVAERYLPDWLATRPLGVVGALDSAGGLLPVEAVVARVRGFFSEFHDGVCLVPAGNREELEQALRPADSLRAEDDRLRHDAWQRLVPVMSIRQLLACMAHPLEPENALLVALRKRATTVHDWRGTRHEVQDLVELPLRRDDSKRADVDGERHEGYPWLRAGSGTLADLVVSLRATETRGTVLTGPPGSGKSMVLVQLFHALNGGARSLDGPALLVRARRLGAHGTLVKQLEPELSGIKATTL